MRNSNATLLGISMGLAVSASAAATTVTLTWEVTTQRATIGEPLNWTKQLILRYEAAHPYVKVDYAIVSREKYLTQILGGVGPDIVEDAGDGFRETGIRGSFLDLTPNLGTDLPDYMADQTFWPPEWGAFTNQGIQFALPRSLATGGLYVNVDLWNAAGLELPSSDLATNRMTWTDLASVCRKLTKTDAFGMVLQPALGLAYTPDAVGPWLLAAGAGYYHNGGHSQSALGSQEATDALGFLQNLAFRSRCLTAAASPAPFIQGRLPIYQGGSWDLDQVLGTKLNGQLKAHFAVRVLPMPIGPSGKRSAIARLDGFAIPRSSPHPAAARQFLDYLVSPEANALRARYSGLQPARRDVLPGYLNLMEATNPDAVRIQAHVFADAGPYAEPLFIYSNQSVADAILGQAIRDILGREAYVFGTWHDAVDRLNAALKQDPYSQWPHPAEPITFRGRDFTSQDVGTVMSGHAETAGDTLQVSAGGAGIQGSQDRFHFVYVPVLGDFVVQARVGALNAPPATAAGLMVRGDLSAGSPNVSVLEDAAGAVHLQRRVEEYGPTMRLKRSAEATATSPWLQLRRQGEEITAAESTDGVNWTEIGRTKVPFEESVLVGMAVASGDEAGLANAVWSGWRLTKDGN